MLGKDFKTVRYKCQEVGPWKAGTPMPGERGQLTNLGQYDTSFFLFRFFLT